MGEVRGEMAKLRLEMVVEVPDELLRLLIPVSDRLGPEEMSRVLPRIMELELHNVSGKAVLRILPQREEA
jgi:hypothetical protein